MINRRFSEIVANVGSNIQDTSTAMATVIKRMVNEAYFDLMRRTNHNNIVSDYSFSTTTQDNVLPSDFGKEIAVYDSTNSIQLVRSDIGREIDNNLSSLSAAGTVKRYAILDMPVRVQPSTEGVISIVSSNNSDNTQAVSIRGISDSVEMTEDVVLTGTSAATSTNSFSRIISISKDGDTLGKVTATVGSDTIAVMSPESRDHKVKIMRLYAPPAQTLTIKAPYTTSPSPMIEDSDVPAIDAADVIEHGATARAWQYKRQFLKAREFARLYEQGIANLMWDTANQPNGTHAFNIGSYTRDIY